MEKKEQRVKLIPLRPLILVLLVSARTLKVFKRRLLLLRSRLILIFMSRLHSDSIPIQLKNIVNNIY